MRLQLIDAIEWGEGNVRNSRLVFTYRMDLAENTFCHRKNVTNFNCNIIKAFYDSFYKRSNTNPNQERYQMIPEKVVITTFGLDEPCRTQSEMDEVFTYVKPWDRGKNPMLLVWSGLFYLFLPFSHSHAFVGLQPTHSHLG